MAGINAAEEFVATAGIIATAPQATAGIAPESATESLDAAFMDHGLTTAAGITRSEPTTSTPRYAWQNNTRLRTLVTTAAVRWQTVLVQSSLENIELFWGTDLTDGSLVVDPSREYPHLQLVVDLTDGDVTHREYAPNVQIVERGDQVAVAGDTYGWPVTLETVYDEEIGGHSVLFFEEYEGS
jgi:hypothetical protein